jgi:hypothetical protein
MAKNVYHDGKLIPVKDWDYDLKKPKVKQPKKQETVAEVVQVVEDAVEQITD